MRFLTSLACHLQYALIIVLIITAVVLFSKWSSFGNAGVYKIKSPNHDKHREPLLKLANKWNKKSESDNNPVASLIHATYAVAYLDAARMVSNAPVNPNDPVNTVLSQRQQAAVQHIHAQCPHVL